MKARSEIARTALFLVGGLLTLLFSAAEARAQEFTYKVQQSRLLRDKVGELVIADTEIRYRSADGKAGGRWTYRDIRLLEILSPTRVRIWTYDDHSKLFGIDESFTLEIVDGSMTKEVSDFLRSRIGRPFVTAFTDETGSVLAELPAKHNHRFGGCEGTLRVFSDHLVYDSEKSGNSRSWRWTDLRTVSRIDPYRFEVLTYEREFGGPGRSYTFALKEAMPEAVFDAIWTNVYRPTPLRMNGPPDIRGEGDETTAPTTPRYQ